MENLFDNQRRVAYKIVNVKLKEWKAKFEKYIPKYVADYLFDKNGEIMYMLSMGSEQSFYYDPKTLEAGVDAILKAVESVMLGDSKKAQTIYKNFADSKVRIDYLFNIIDKLDIYFALEDAIVFDLDEYAKEQTATDVLEVIENRKINIRHRAESERRELAGKKTSQPF